MSEFRMPSLGADMEDGTLLEWKVKPSDQVRRGDIVAVVDTQKGAIDVEIFEDGEIAEIVVPEGQKVPVGTILAHVKGKGGETEPAAASSPPPEPIAAAPTPAPVATFTPPPPVTGAHRISPAARRRARELNIDPDTVTGTGPGGAVTSEDVEAAAGTAPKTPATKPRSAAQEMRRAIGAAMARSKREIPHYYLSGQVDLGDVSAWLEKENAARPVTERMIMGVLFIKATALALRDIPEFNGFWKDGAFEPGSGIHPGIAISLRSGGLVVPALHDANEKDLATLMNDFQELVQRARTARLKSSELADGTITITSLGERGVDCVFPIIYPPQVAIVGFGSVLERPWCTGSQVTARPVVTISLGADHRVTDGHRGGLFLRAIEKHLLEIPGK